MNEKLYITRYCSVSNNTVTLDGRVIHHDASENNFAVFIKSAYKLLKLSYPKFYKMDNLCKLALIASETLLNYDNFADNYKSLYKPEDIGIIVSNSSSSLDTDMQFQATIEDKENYFPSPAVFVYTLPNILIGEIAIKNNIKGENACFISEKFDSDLMCFYTESLFAENKINASIAGWVEYFEGKYNAILFFIEKNSNDNAMIFNSETIQQLYQKYIKKGKLWKRL